MAIEVKDCITVANAARRLNVDQSQLRREIKQGKMLAAWTHDGKCLVPMRSLYHYAETKKKRGRPRILPKQAFPVGRFMNPTVVEDMLPPGSEA